MMIYCAACCEYRLRGERSCADSARGGMPPLDTPRPYGAPSLRRDGGLAL